MNNEQSAAFEAFKNWWDREAQEELRRSCAQGWAWKVWQARAALDSEQQPDVTQLVEALEQAGLALHEMDEGHAALVDIDNALAAYYRKEGEV